MLTAQKYCNMLGDHVKSDQDLGLGLGFRVRVRVRVRIRVNLLKLFHHPYCLHHTYKGKGNPFHICNLTAWKKSWSD